MSLQNILRESCSTICITICGSSIWAKYRNRVLIFLFGADFELPIQLQWKFAVDLHQTVPEEENSEGSK